jgi:hypothetical protein
MRYTRTQESTLMYWSCEKSFQAGQLGLGAYRIQAICPACGFGTKPFVLLGPIDLGGRSEYCEYCFWVGSENSKDEPVEGYLIAGFHERAHGRYCDDKLLRLDNLCTYRHILPCGEAAPPPKKTLKIQ